MTTKIDLSSYPFVGDNQIIDKLKSIDPSKYPNFDGKQKLIDNLAQNKKYFNSKFLELNNDSFVRSTDTLEHFSEATAYAISDTITAINEELASYDLQSYEAGVLNNNTNEILLKQDQLLEFENNNLLTQLRELETVQSSITNKDRIIQELDESIQKKNKYIYFFSITIFFAFVLLIITILYGNKNISSGFYKILIIIDFVILFLIMCYIFNIFHIHDIVHYTTFTREMRIRKKLNEWGEKIDKNIDEKRNKWIDANCNCPAPEEITTVTQEAIYSLQQNVQEQTLGGYFYNDGTSPQQVLVKSPNTYDSDSVKYIDWVDYSKSGNMHYDNNIKKIIYNDNNYYNYNGKRDPKIILNDNLINSHRLVDPETVTRDL